MMAHRFTKDKSGKFATEYLQIITYIAIAAALGVVVFGDNFDNFLSDIRRALLGNDYG